MSRCFAVKHAHFGRREYGAFKKIKVKTNTIVLHIYAQKLPAVGNIS